MGEAASAGRLPASYRSAAWRNTTPVDAETGLIGVGFELPDGRVLRLALSIEGARQLAETLADYLETGHSARSSGRSSSDGSMPPGIETT